MARKKKDASSIDNYIKPSPGLSFFLNGGYESNVAAAIVEKSLQTCWKFAQEL